jgi:antibiotic biosynthesis monooxygenase (ABM) superfamily enzyme
MTTTSTNGPGEGVTAVVRRRIKPGHEASFEALMEQFVCFAMRQPGNLGINVIRGAGADERDYTILDRFATEEDRRRFTGSADYAEWMQRLREVSETGPDIQEVAGGLAFWFTVPRQTSGARLPPPRTKMALVTLLGVYPLSMLFPVLVKSALPDLPGWLQGLLIAAAIVVSLTWAVMPLLTRMFEGWLFPETKKEEEGK